MRIFFIGESWLGSSARRLREAMQRCPDVVLDDIGEDQWFPHPRSRWLRAINRVTAPAYRREFNAAVLRKVDMFEPRVAVVYKGHHVRLDLVEALRARGVFTVNVFPDYSPHTQGASIRRTLGGYDLVISTKVYYPERWRSMYGYSNRCIFVPHGYDPALHLCNAAPPNPEFDVAMVATWRPEYGRLLHGFAQHLPDPSLRVAIGGSGWRQASADLPSNWTYLGGCHGHAYVNALRSARICIAPLNRDVVVDGQPQPGDVDTNRTYELAAAHCFFIHQRTDYARALYDEGTEVSMFESAGELAAQVRRYLADPEARASMAAAAHRRAVPAYAIDRRALDIVDAVREMA